MRYVNASRPHTHTTITIRPQASVIHPSKRRPSREDVAVTKCEPCTSPLLSSFRFGAEICERLLLPLLLLVLLAHYFFITWFIPTERTRPWDFARKHSVRLHPFNIRDGCHPHARTAPQEDLNAPRRDRFSAVSEHWPHESRVVPKYSEEYASSTRESETEKSPVTPPFFYHNHVEAGSFFYFQMGTCPPK